MIIWAVGTVCAVIDQRSELQMVRVKIICKYTCIKGECRRLQVDLTQPVEEAAIHDSQTQGSLVVGERVLLNVTAVQMKLGTGGYHFVHSRFPWQEDQDERLLLANLTENVTVDTTEDYSGGHIMKLRYTSAQRTVLAAEEPASEHHHVLAKAEDLYHMPVLIGELHSMLPVAVAWIQHNSRLSGRPVRIAYLMSDGGALPLALSEHVACLRQLEWLVGTITYGHAYGGDVEAVNKFTALLAARHVLRADIAIAVMGPGIVGTGTTYGHTGMEVAELAHAASLLGGQPILIPRINTADARSRHLGLSHHTRIIATRCLSRTTRLPLPTGLPSDIYALVCQQAAEFSHLATVDWQQDPTESQIADSLESYPLPVKTMGRGLAQEPVFYLGVGAAAQAAWDCWQRLLPAVETSTLPK